MKKITLVLTLCLSFAAQAGLLYTYNRLALKDLDQMNKLIKDKIKESRAEGGDKTIPLKEALQAVFSRPNEDFMIEKILSPLRTELDEYGAWEKSIRALTKESLGALKNPTAFKSEAQVTYAIFLENLVSELRPKADEPFEKSMLEQIRDADIELTKAAQSERQLRMMRELVSPSSLAKAALESVVQKPKAVSADPAAGNAGVGNYLQTEKPKPKEHVIDKNGQPVWEQPADKSSTEKSATDKPAADSK